MTALCYELDSERRGNALYLKITISAPERALPQLIAEEKRYRDRYACDRGASFKVCRVGSAKAFEILKMLGTTGRLTRGGLKVVVDPFSQVELWVDEERDGNRVRLTGKWKKGQQSGSLSDCEWLFLADNGFCIKDRCIYPITAECSLSCIERVYPQPQWIEEPQKEDVEPVPFLRLSDRHGAFADLWFDYSQHGSIAMHDPLSSPWRKPESEKGWEKDLLETGFVKKWLDASRYYCPLDKVAKTLSFILEIGWKIYDHRQRQVLRQKKHEVRAEADGAHILIRGKVHYEQHTADLTNCVGVFNRKERFIDLSPDAVGLLDTEVLQIGEGLQEHEIIADAVAVKRHHVGLLADLLAPEHKGHDYAELFSALPEKWNLVSGEVPSSFQGQLFDYQKDGVKWLEFLREGGCSGLLADEMGLGKTVQVVAFFSQLVLQKNCLIVVPTSLLFSWKREFDRFLPSCPVVVYAGKERVCLTSEEPRVILTSYALLRLEAEMFQGMDFQVIVLDEAQMIKNPESQIARCIFSLQAEMRLAMTGTPIENSLQDLWSLFHFLLPDLLGAKSDFQAALQAAGSDMRYVQQIKRKIRPFLLRRKKQNVLQQLPPKMEQLVWVDMTEAQRLLYDQWLQRTKAGLIQKVGLDGTSAHRMEILEAILRLRQLCVHPSLVETDGSGDFFTLSGKMERLFSDLEEIVGMHKKVLVYSQFTTMLHLIRREVANKGWSYVYLDGSTQNRESVVQNFQEDASISIFLISLKAGGVGLNLTAADYVFLLDPWWNEAVEQQAIDRAHRVGRKEAVIARRYVAALTIEEKILHLKKHKLGLSQGLFEEGGDLSSLSLSDLMHLILN